jgi:hypothetical protein
VLQHQDEKPVVDDRLGGRSGGARRLIRFHEIAPPSCHRRKTIPQSVPRRRSSMMWRV